MPVFAFVPASLLQCAPHCKCPPSSKAKNKNSLKHQTHENELVNLVILIFAYNPEQIPTLQNMNVTAMCNYETFVCCTSRISGGHEHKIVISLPNVNCTFHTRRMKNLKCFILIKHVCHSI